MKCFVNHYYLFAERFLIHHLMQFIFVYQLNCLPFHLSNHLRVFFLMSLSFDSFFYFSFLRTFILLLIHFTSTRFYNTHSLCFIKRSMYVCIYSMKSSRMIICKIVLYYALITDTLCFKYGLI